MNKSAAGRTRTAAHPTVTCQLRLQGGGLHMVAYCSFIFTQSLLHLTNSSRASHTCLLVFLRHLCGYCSTAKPLVYEPFIPVARCHRPALYEGIEWVHSQSLRAQAV